MLAVLLATGASGQPAPAVAGQREEFPHLTSGAQLQRKISPGEAHSYPVELSTNQYFRALVEHSAGAAVVSLCPPGGQECVELNARPHRAATISLAAKASGQHRLVFRSREENDSAGDYRLRVEALREATAADAGRVAAEKAYAEGERLRAEWTAESSRRAVDAYRSAATLWGQAGDRREEAVALSSVASTLQHLNELHESLKYYESSLALGRRVGDHRVECEALSGLGSVHLALGNTEQALAYFRRARAVAVRAQDRAGEAQAVNNLADAYYTVGDMRRALDYCADALVRWRGLNDRRGQASALLIAGEAHSNLSNIRDALDAFGQSLRLWRGVKNRRGEAHTLTAVGHLQSKLGEKQQALDLYRQARPLFRTMGDGIGEAFILNGMGYVYDELGEKEVALGYHEEAHRLFQSAAYRDGEAGALLRMGEIHYSRGDGRKALEFFQKSLDLCKATGIRLFEPYLLRDIGMAHESFGDHAEALRYYRRALALNRGAGQDRRWQAHTYNNIAQVHERLGDGRSAKDYYRRALALNRATADRFGESTTLYNLARLERDAGSLDDARAHIQDALLISESLRAGVVSQMLRASYFASARQCYELYVDVLMRLHEQRPGEGHDVAAFEASEKARARSFLETLNEARDGDSAGVDPSLIERQRAIQHELNAKAERRMQLLAGRQSAAEAEAVTKEIDRLTIEYDQVSSQIKAGNPRYASWSQPQPLSLAEVRRQALDDDSLLLEYFLGERRSYLWAITKSEITSYELPPRAEIESLVSQLYDLLTARQASVEEGPEQRRLRVSEADRLYWPQASALSRIVLGPVAERMTAKRLVIIADGGLQYIPFQALPMPATHERAGGESAGIDSMPLVVKYEVVNQPSASSLATLRDEMSRRAAAPKVLALVADPIFEKDDPRIQAAGAPQADDGPPPATELARALGDVGLRSGEGGIPRLFASQAEAAAIAAAVPTGEVFKAVGFDASRSTVMSADLGQYRIVHFATHGILDNRHPELSGIVLSLFDRQGRRQDGFLRLHDIYNLKLPADLVVLSACNTGLGKDVKGEGLVGLTRGFMYAGSGSIVASLWKVDDRATSELMTHFYRGMLVEGLPPAAALRESQIKMWKQRRWQSPYYWAAFTFQGEYRTQITVTPQGLPGPRPAFFALAGAILLMLSLGGLVIVRRGRRREVAT